MEWSLETIMVLFSTGVATILGLFYFYMTFHFQYWRKKGVPFVKPTFPFGNLSDFVGSKTPVGKFYQSFYRQFKNEKYVGIFEGRLPTLIITDLNLAQHVLVKDFECFTDHDLPPISSHDFLSKSLTGLQGENWKHSRSKVSAFFSLGKVRMMQGVIEKYSVLLKEHLDGVSENGGKMDVRETITKFTMNILSSSALGIESDSLEPNRELYDIYKISCTLFNMSVLKKYFMYNFPLVSKLFQMSPFPAKQKSFYLNFVANSIQDRKTTNVCKNDLIETLTRSSGTKPGRENPNGSLNCSTEGMSAEDIAALVAHTFQTGLETSALVILSALHSLAHDDDMQRRLQHEVDEVVKAHGDKLTCESLTQMKFLDQVVYETLRHPRSAGAFDRQVVKPYRLPDSDVVLDTGVKVIVPMYAIHHDPDLFPAPDTFDPGRFADNGTSLHKYSFLPFGVGPRACIAKRFALTQVKMGIATLMRHFHLSKSPETCALSYSTKTFITVPDKPIILRISRRFV